MNSDSRDITIVIKAVSIQSAIEYAALHGIHTVQLIDPDPSRAEVKAKVPRDYLNEIRNWFNETPTDTRPYPLGTLLLYSIPDHPAAKEPAQCPPPPTKIPF